MPKLEGGQDQVTHVVALLLCIYENDGMKFGGRGRGASGSSALPAAHSQVDCLQYHRACWRRVTLTVLASWRAGAVARLIS